MCIKILKLCCTQLKPVQEKDNTVKVLPHFVSLVFSDDVQSHNKIQNMTRLYIVLTVYQFYDFQKLSAITSKILLQYLAQRVAVEMINNECILFNQQFFFFQVPVYLRIIVANLWLFSPLFVRYNSFYLFYIFIVKLFASTD